MIYKLTDGVSANSLDLWKLPAGVGLNNTTNAYINLVANGHYVSPFKDDAWRHTPSETTSNATFLRVHANLMEGNTIKRYITFNPDTTDKMTWFARNYAVDSDWTDLWTEYFNYFSIVGRTESGRAWCVCC